MVSQPQVHPTTLDARNEFLHEAAQILDGHGLPVSSQDIATDVLVDLLKAANKLADQRGARIAEIVKDLAFTLAFDPDLDPQFTAKLGKIFFLLEKMVMAVNADRERDIFGGDFQEGL